MFQDEARFGRISAPRRCWYPWPHRAVCKRMVTRECTYAYGAVSIKDGQWDSLILPRANAGCVQVFLDGVSARHPGDRIIMVLDGAGWHRSASLAVPGNMRLLPLPPCSPELNPVENIWEELREKCIGSSVFDSMAELEDRLQVGLKHLEDHPGITKSISAWPWIINAISI